MHCPDRTLSSQFSTPVVSALGRFTLPEGEECWKWVGDPVQYHEAGQLLGMRKGAIHRELQCCLTFDLDSTTSSSKQQWFDSQRRCWADGAKVKADVLIGVTFFDGRRTRGAVA